MMIHPISYLYFNSFSGLKQSSVNLPVIICENDIFSFFKSVILSIETMKGWKR